MKKMKFTKIAAVLAVLLTFTACSSQYDGNRTVVKEQDKSIVVIENENTEAEPFPVSVERIDKYEGMEITDWLDDKITVLAKENPELGKMSLLEKSEFYPRSIYLYNLETKEYREIKAQKNMFLGGAKLSPDKKRMLYYEYSIGDTAHYLTGIGDGEQSSIKDDSLGIAITARWTKDNSVIGASYSGGAYIADTGRNLTQIDELQNEQVFTVQKTRERIYYITMSDIMRLYMFDPATKEKKDLNLENAFGITPSPDGKQLLITQWEGAVKKLLIADAEGKILRTAAEGTEVTGESWSPDQRLVAYQMESVVNGTTNSGLYLYDVLTDTSMQITVNIGPANISWSPSGNKIAVAESDGRYYNSSIIYLK
jgi:TolB protein